MKYSVAIRVSVFKWLEFKGLMFAVNYFQGAGALVFSRSRVQGVNRLT